MKPKRQKFGTATSIVIVATTLATFVGAAEVRIVAWGNNITGQGIGVSSWDSSDVIGTVSLAGQKLSDASAIAAGDFHALALRPDGSVISWGFNDKGQATAPPALRGVVAIAAGSRFSVALTREGRVVAWGSNRFGQT